MKGPRIRKTLTGWECVGAGVTCKGRKISSAYKGWFATISKEIKSSASQVSLLQEIDKNHQHVIAELSKRVKQLEATRELIKPDEKWIAERICFYNQKCIDFIWLEKRLPTIDEYKEFTGRN